MADGFFCWDSDHDRLISQPPGKPSFSAPTDPPLALCTCRLVNLGHTPSSTGTTFHIPYLLQARASPPAPKPPRTPHQHPPLSATKCSPRPCRRLPCPGSRPSGGRRPGLGLQNNLRLDRTTLVAHRAPGPGPAHDALAVPGTPPHRPSLQRRHGGLAARRVAVVRVAAEAELPKVGAAADGPGGVWVPGWCPSSPLGGCGAAGRRRAVRRGW